ncbi:PIR protein, partial [Plasmodium vivax]
MSCSSNEKIDRYDFSNNIDKYITEVKKIENPIPPNTPLTDCDEYSNIHSLGNKEKANILCNNFSRLNKFLVSIKSEIHNYCNFLNYWFNSELSQALFSKNDSISDVYIGMETYLYTNQEYSPLNCELCNIN